MIPKKIHYCWFGGTPKPELALKCISSWKQYCPDYEIIEWNENNFDINMNAYTKMCYEQKKYAFLSDYIRLVVLYKYGGLYFDTDVEAIKPFDKLLNCEAFIGFETNTFVNTGQGFGAEPKSSIVKQMMDEYKCVIDGVHGIIGCPNLNTATLKKYGFSMTGEYQTINNVVLYPSDYFNPFDDTTGKLHKTNNTYSIHWYGKSWMSKTRILRNRLARFYHRLRNGIKVKG